MTCTGDWEIGAVSVRLTDNPGELVDDMSYHGTTLYWGINNLFAYRDPLDHQGLLDQQDVVEKG